MMNTTTISGIPFDNHSRRVYDNFNTTMRDLILVHLRQSTLTSDAVTIGDLQIAISWASTQLEKDEGLECPSDALARTVEQYHRGETVTIPELLNELQC